MTFLAPLALLGLAALAIPVLAHLLGRQEPLVLELATQRFLEEADPSVTRRRTPREPLLLALRLLALLAAVVAIARPVTFARSDLAVVSTAHDAVLLIDGSRSMGLTQGGRDGMRSALARAEVLVDALPAGSRVALLTSDPLGPVIELTEDRASIRAALAEWAARGLPRAWSAELADSVPAAVELLRTATEASATARRPKAIYAVSDETARGLGGLPANVGDVEIIAVHVGTPQTPVSHVALVDIAAEPAAEVDARAVRIRGVVQQSRAVPVSTEDDADPSDASGAAMSVTVVLEIEGSESARTRVEVGPGSASPVEFVHMLTGDAPVAATLRVVDVDGTPAEEDPLVGDEARRVWLGGTSRTRVLLVDGDPSDRRVEDEVFFLSTALADEGDTSAWEVHAIAADQLADRVRERGDAALAEVDVLVLANVPAPSAEVADALTRRVTAGMGLWITCGSHVEPSAYNGALGPLLPLRLRAVVEAGTLPGRTAARGEGLSPPHRTHPVVAASDGIAALTSATTHRLVLVDPDPRGNADVAIAFESGSPALVTTEVGRGRVALLTTTIDREWSDLALRPGFVPLARESIGWLAAGTRATAQPTTWTGQPRTLPGDRPVVIRRDGVAIVPPGDEQPHVWADTWTEGHYEVREGTETGPVLANFVIDPDPAESDIQTARAPEGAASEHVADGRTAPRTEVPRWRWLAILLALALVAESWLRSSRAGARRPAA